MTLTAEEKRLYKDFEALARQVAEGTVAAVIERPEEKAARLVRVLGDYNAFVRWYFPNVANVDCARFQIEWAQAVTSNPRFYGVQEWPRGHGKTMHSAVMLPMWLKAKGQLRMFELIGRNEEMAMASMADLMDQLETNERYITDFGVQVNVVDWKPWSFTTRDGVRFVAYGLGQNPRGTRNRQYRPDYILVDDIDDEKWVGNPRLVAEAVDKLEAAVYGTMDMGRGRFIVAGNRIHHDGVLARMSRKAVEQGFVHSQVRALEMNEEGQEVPAWPEKYTVAEIKQTMAMMQRRKARQEYLNEPDVDGQVFKESQIRFGDRALQAPKDSMILYIDPSFTKKGDSKAAVLVSKVGRQYFVHDVFCRKCESEVLIGWVYRVADRLRNLNVRCDYQMDASAQQGLHQLAFDHYGQERGWKVPIVLDKRETRGRKINKTRRIAEMAAYFERQEVSFDGQLEHKDDFVEFRRQLLGFTGARNQPDDGPDALESAISLLRVRTAIPYVRIGGSARRKTA
jgi:hypothetical protein